MQYRIDSHSFQTSKRTAMAVTAERCSTATSITFDEGSIGLTFDAKLVVVNTVAGSQAASKGVKPGLRLVDIGGVSVDGQSLDNVFGLLRELPRPLSLGFVVAATTAAPILPHRGTVDADNTHQPVMMPDSSTAVLGSAVSETVAAAGGSAAPPAASPGPSATQPTSTGRANVFGGFGRALIGGLASVRDAASTGLGSLGDRIGAGLALPMAATPGSAASYPDIAHAELHRHRAVISQRLAESRERSARIGALAAVVDDRVAAASRQTAEERQQWNQLDAALSSCLPALSRDCGVMREQAERLGGRIAALAAEFGRVTVAAERKRAMTVASEAGASLERRAAERRVAVSRLHERASKQLATLAGPGAAGRAPILAQLVSHADDEAARHRSITDSPAASDTAAAAAASATSAPASMQAIEPGDSYAGQAVTRAGEEQVAAAAALVTGAQAAGALPDECLDHPSAGATEVGDKENAMTIGVAVTVAEVRGAASKKPLERPSSFMEIRKRFSQAEQSNSALPQLEDAETPPKQAKAVSMEVVRRGRVKSLIAKFGKKPGKAIPGPTVTAE